MSGKATGMVWELDIPHNQQYVLLAMADHADHDGEHIYPSISALAWKTGYSNRQVQRVIKALMDSGVIELTREANGYRSTNHYRIAWDKAPKKKPRDTRGDKMSTQTKARGDILARRGDIWVSPKPSIEQIHNTNTGIPKIVGTISLPPDPLGDELNSPIDNKLLAKAQQAKATANLSAEPTPDDLSSFLKGKALEETPSKVPPKVSPSKPKRTRKPKADVPPPDEGILEAITVMCHGTPDAFALNAGTVRGCYNAIAKCCAPITLAQLDDFKVWWTTNDWRGQKGQRPTVHQIKSAWATAMMEANGGSHESNNSTAIGAGAAGAAQSVSGAHGAQAPKVSEPSNYNPEGNRAIRAAFNRQQLSSVRRDESGNT